MNFVFRPYPTHPWLTDWQFEPTGCHASYRESFRDHFFKSRKEIGRLVPDSESADWFVQIPVPQNSDIHLLANGFCAYFEKRGVKCGAEVLCPEPGILWGRFLDIPTPVLVFELPMEEDGATQWMETGSQNVLLSVRNDTFCLVSKSTLRKDANTLADEYLARDFEQAIQQEMERRSGAVALFENMAHHDSLGAICTESMFKALRPPEGRIPHLWSQSATSDTPRFDLNELHPLALAWSMIAPEIAEELVLCALKIQTNAGAIPAHISPSTTFSVAESPKPLIAKTAEKVWMVRKDPDYLKTILPLLRRHVQWLLQHFDPKRRGNHSWKGQSECIVPELFKSDLVSVDLAALLLTEIEAVHRLQLQLESVAHSPPFFKEDGTQLAQNMIELFWNESTNSFSNAYHREKVEELRGFPELLPLLWMDLPQVQKDAVIDQVRRSEKLPGQHSVLGWHQSAMDGSAFPLVQQALLLLFLKTAVPRSDLLRDLSRLTIQGFVEWHTLSLESSQSLKINPAIAAHVLNVQAVHEYRYQNKETSSRVSKLLKKARLDRTDALIACATLIAIYCIHLFYDTRKSPPTLADLQVLMESAYGQGDAQAAAQACTAIIGTYPGEAAKARLFLSNIYMLGGWPEQAIPHLEELRKEYPDCPAAMVSLGLARQIGMDFQAAETNYYEFCYLFDEIFPEAVAEVSKYRTLMQEGFNSPPRWQDVYRFRFMHELAP